MTPPADDGSPRLFDQPQEAARLSIAGFESVLFRDGERVWLAVDASLLDALGLSLETITTTLDALAAARKAGAACR